MPKPLAPKPTLAPTSEAQTNAEALFAKPTKLADNNVAEQVRRGQAMNRPFTFQSTRTVLGLGVAIIHPNSEAILPYDTLATSLVKRIPGIGEGEGVALLEGSGPTAHKLAKEEKVFLLGRTDAADDFAIPRGRPVRFHVFHTRGLLL